MYYFRWAMALKILFTAQPQEIRAESPFILLKSDSYSVVVFEELNVNLALCWALLDSYMRSSGTPGEILSFSS